MEFNLNSITSKILVLFALGIVAITLLYTNNLASKLKVEEKKKVALWAKATKEASINNSNYDIGFIFEVVSDNTTVPVILTNENNDIINWRNIKKTDS